MWAARPHLGSIFEKLLHRKTFICLRLVTENNSLRKTSPIRFGKAGAHPQLAWESQLPLKPCISLPPLDFKGNCDSLWFSLRFYLRILVQFDLLRKCGLLAHTSAAFLKNCCTEKLLFACGSNSATCFRCIKKPPFYGRLFCYDSACIFAVDSSDTPTSALIFAIQFSSINKTVNRTES